MDKLDATGRRIQLQIRCTGVGLLTSQGSVYVDTVLINKVNSRVKKELGDGASLNIASFVNSLGRAPDCEYGLRKTSEV